MAEGSTNAQNDAVSKTEFDELKSEMINFVTELPSNPVKESYYGIIPKYGKGYVSLSDLYYYLDNPVPGYSIIYDKSLAPDPSACLSYGYSMSDGFIPMSNSSEGSWNKNGDLFDAIKCGYFNNGTWVEFDKSNIVGNSTYDCYTKIPKIYQRVTDLSDAKDNSKVQLDLSLSPFEGATLHPAFIMDGVEKDNIYIGRYLASTASSVYLGTYLRSVSGKTVAKNLTRAEYREYAKNHGSNYGLLSYFDWDLISKLFLMGFKSFDSKNVLGYGYMVSSGMVGTGQTDSHPWMFGDPTSYTTNMSFLGLEDWWGNSAQVMDNNQFADGGLYVSSSFNPTDDISDKTLISSGSKVDDRVASTCKAGLNDFFLAESIGSISVGEGLCNRQYLIYTNGYYLGADNNYGKGSVGGAFQLYSFTMTNAGPRGGARLVYKP